MKHSILLAVILISTIASAQQYGSVKGVIQDTSGNVLEDAILLLEDSAQYTYTVISDVKGNYLFKNIPVGTYTLTALILGIRPVKYINVAVRSGNETIVDFKLLPAKYIICYDPLPLDAIDMRENPSSTTYLREDIIHMATPR